MILTLVVSTPPNNVEWWIIGTLVAVITFFVGVTKTMVNMGKAQFDLRLSEKDAQIEKLQATLEEKEKEIKDLYLEILPAFNANNTLLEQIVKLLP